MNTLIILVAAPAVLALVVACFRDPLGFALPAYALLVPFGQGVSVGLPGPFGSVSSLLGVLLTAALLARLPAVRRGAPRLAAPVPVWLALLGFAAASIFWSVAPRATAISVMILGSLVVLYVLVAISEIEKPTLVRVENALLVGGVASACYGIVQLTFFSGLPAGEHGQGVARFGDDLLGPNNQAAALLLPLAIALWRTTVRSGRTQAVSGVTVLILLLGILMTGSRGGLIAVATVFAVVILLSRRGRGPLIACTAVATGLLAAVLLLNPADIGKRQVSNDSSSGRDAIWAVGFTACETYCLTGSGWGTFPVVYSSTQSSVPEARVLRTGTAFQPHNIGLLAGIEVGVVGLLLVALGLGLTAADAYRLPPSLRAPPAAALTGIIVAGFFLSNLEFKFFWMVLIYVALCKNFSQLPSADRRTVGEPPPGADDPRMTSASTGRASGLGATHV